MGPVASSRAATYNNMLGETTCAWESAVSVGTHKADFNLLQPAKT